MSEKLSFQARRRGLFGGVLLAHGYFFPKSVLSDAEAQARAFREARPGDRLFDTSLGLALRFATPRRADTTVAPATALVNSGGVLCSAPLDPGVWRAAPEAVLAIVCGGEPVFLSSADMEELPLWKLIDLGSLNIEPVESLGELAPPREPLEKAEDPTKLIGQKLGIGEIERLAQKHVIEGLARAESTARPRGRALSKLLLRAAGWLSALSRGRAKAPSGTGRSRQALQAQVRPGRLRRLFEAIARAVERRLFLSIYASKQADYLRRLFDLLEAKSDEEALRQAIPLGKDGESEAGRLALAPPEPRSSLDINLAPRRAEAAFALGGDLFARLRASYERLFERLDRAGRHQEAAFVLVELLNDVERAVGYLEQQGRFDVAANLAEARGFAPARCVRLWFLARNIERAVAIAVRYDCFAQAIERLEVSNRASQARELSLLYADRLASAGKLVSAAELVAHERDMESVTLHWLELARAGADFTGVALELELAPKRFDAVWQSVCPLFEDPTLRVNDEHLSLARALLQRPSHAAVPLTRALSRRLITAAAEHGNESVATTARKLASSAGGAFDADFPRIASFSRRLSKETVRRSYRANSAGTRELFDACRRGRRWLVALGEAGVALLNDAGRVIRHFDVPANSLVVAPGSEHVLAVMQREQVHRVSRIHLGTSRAERWGDLELSVFARSFDGERWFVERHRPKAPVSELCMLDVLADTPRVSERVQFDRAFVYQIALSSNALHLVLVSGRSFDIVSMSLPDFQLRKRVLLESADPFEQAPIAISETGSALMLEAYAYDPVTNPTATLRLLQDGRTVLDDLFPKTAIGGSKLRTHGDYFALSAELKNRDGGCTRVLAGSLSQGRCTLELDLEGLSVANLRLDGPTLWVCLREGRALCFDVETAEELASLRW